MKRLLIVLVVLCGSCGSSQIASPEVQSWEQTAQGITIVRDDWGIAHVYGQTDADAVFGMIYAQAEDDFNRIEVNYLNAMGRLAEAEGEKEIFRDLRMKLFIDPEDIKAKYEESPAWLKQLMEAWADGLNYFLHVNPQVQPRVIKRFEPWMALTFTEGSIGGDIETISLRDLEEFYGNLGSEERRVADLESFQPLEPTGSNGIAIAPSNTVNGHSLLLINPHTSFYFRDELQMVSQEGLNAYGAVTWGQFFIYQGFNENAGWMHTSSGADAIDEYAYEVVERDGGVFYRYGDEERQMRESVIRIPYKNGEQSAEREFKVYRSHHGPIVRSQDGRWISVKLMQEPLKALTQSYSRTKVRNYEEFKQTMELHTNSSNNTVFADREGNIAYFHANFVPIRDPEFDWRKPVTGNDPRTEWKGMTGVDDSPNALNPPGGWIQNTNNWPYSVSGESSPRQADYPAYMETVEENPRGLHAIRVLEGRRDFTVDSLVEAAYDSYLPAFESLIPSLVAAYNTTSGSNPLKQQLSEQMAVLEGWDYRFGVDSVATTLAVYWGEELWRRVASSARDEDLSVYDYMASRTSPQERLEALAAASDRLTEDFGDWRTAWGTVNRFQRITGDIVHPFDDNDPSIPVGFTSGRWGSLAAFGTVRRDTKKNYGVSGNSFVAVVEFGDKVRARAVTAGGISGDPASPHFKDQAMRYSMGDLRSVYFYRDEVEAHREREYKPGEQ